MTSTYDFHLSDFTFILVDLTWSLKLSIWSNHAEHPKGLAQFIYATPFYNVTFIYWFLPLR